MENAAATLGNASSAASAESATLRHLFVFILLRVFPGFLMVSFSTHWSFQRAQIGFYVSVSPRLPSASDFSSFIPLGSGNAFLIILNVLRLC